MILNKKRKLTKFKCGAYAAIQIIFDFMQEHAVTLLQHANYVHKEFHKLGNAYHFNIFGGVCNLKRD